VPFVLRVAVLLAFTVAASADEPLKVGRITIHALDIYSKEEASKGSVYRLADRLHRETRRTVIEQFLLFHEGEVFSAAALEETERNLRALGFLKSASVVASPPHDGVVDVTVVTQDAWSISPETQAGSKGGTNTFGATLEDSNLFGFGKAMSLGWSRGVDRNSLGLTYNDPAFFAPYWRAQLGYALTSDGYDRRVTVGRPFYSFTTPWATHFAYANVRQTDRLYTSGVVTSRFEHMHRLLIASYGIARNPNADQAQRFTTGLRFVDDDYEALNGSTPSARAFRYVFFRYDTAVNRFMKLNFVNKDLRYEDFDLGRQLSVEAAVSPKFLGAPATTGFVRLGAANGRPLSDEGFALVAGHVSGRLDRGIRNAIASVSASYVHRELGDHPRAFVARAVANRGWRTDANVQFFADGVTGLRGYNLHVFSGSRSAVVNLEQRLYLGREILQLASPGIVAFFDAGSASDRGFAVKSDAGIGVRIGLPRSPRNLLRIDLAFPLQRDPLGRKKPMLSFSSGQAF
jgi:outer membrane protein assembly factor BamA